ncbi:TPA: histidinol dehydrogenase [Candidatus Galligastranaerophilus faecipullorum]|nr:histidinol dehydrogenase [Candidatus Galligastranaerophilus faecipullorum]
MKIITSHELFKNQNHEFFKTAALENLQNVEEIIEDIKKNGDKSIIHYSKTFNDGDFSSGEDFIVSEEEIKKAYEMTDDKTINALEKCIENVRDFAQEQLSCLKNLDMKKNNSLLGHRVIPLERVLCYVPGGNYPLPSSAVMTCTPAKVAGVREVIITSPRIKPRTIVAAKMSGADKVYKLGGVQAIGAFAYGSDSIKPVDKIVGPGNKYVTYAKKYVYGKCSIDFLAGPSEVLIVADDNQNPELVSADILAQCEHDRDARGYLICFSKDFAQKVADCAQKQLQTLETRDIAQISFEKSTAVIVNDIKEAVKISNLRAPEHLELMFDGAWEKSKDFTNYGSLFIGSCCAEVFGDYCSGTNHVLPTNSAARYTGGLSVFDFVKIQTYQMLSKEYSKELSVLASQMAQQEGLMGHKLASDLRRI